MCIKIGISSIKWLDKAEFFKIINDLYIVEVIKIKIISIGIIPVIA